MAKNKIPKSLAETIALSFQLGYLITLPILIFAIGGRVLDKRLNTSPLFLLIGIGLAIIISAFLIYRKIKEIIKDEEKGK